MKRVNSDQQSRSEDDSDSDSSTSKKHKESKLKAPNRNKEENNSSGLLNSKGGQIKVNTQIDSDNSDELKVTQVCPANKPAVSPAAAFNINGKLCPCFNILICIANGYAFVLQTVLQVRRHKRNILQEQFE